MPATKFTLEDRNEYLEGFNNYHQSVDLGANQF